MVFFGNLQEKYSAVESLLLREFIIELIINRYQIGHNVKVQHFLIITFGLLSLRNSVVLIYRRENWEMGVTPDIRCKGYLCRCKDI